MILSLRIHHLALIDSLALEFRSGMHVLTGETGAGKSIVVDAVNLVLGGRSDRDMIRTGTDKAWVEADFSVENNAAALQLLRDNEIEAEGDTVTLYREISQTGRNIARVCGVTMPLTFVKELSALLMDVHGQHEHRFLMDPVYHLQFLDASGDEAHAELMRKTAESCEAFLNCHRKLVRLKKENDNKNRRVEELKKGLAELEKAAFKPDEEEALTREKESFRHAEKISSALRGAFEAINADEVGDSPLNQIREASNQLKTITDMGENYASLSARAESAFYELQELRYDLDALLDSDLFDPARAEFVETRLDLIRRMEKKYGATLADVLAEQEKMRLELERFESMDEEVTRMEHTHRKLLGEYRVLARQLTESRKQLAAQFEVRMMDQLKDLGMEKTVFSVAFAEKPDGKPSMPQPLGDDNLEFMISPNPGEPLRSLSKIASGGELSRLMLAIKSLEAEHDGLGCMVFDEIDTGISGRMAQVVAEKMAAISLNRQVICVTHLPQIAAIADHEYLVAKHVEEGRTLTGIRLLDAEGRVEEIARMLGGAGDSMESAKKHAAVMLEEAARLREQRRQEKKQAEA